MKTAVNKISALAFLCIVLPLLCQGAAREVITVNLEKPGNHVSPTMYGVFFEEINHAGDGGLYAELVRNRSFEEKEMPEGYRSEGDRIFPKEVCYHLDGKVRDRSFRWSEEDVPGWTLSVPESVASMRVVKEAPMFPGAPNNLRIDIAEGNKTVRLVNDGYWGMNLKAGEPYDMRVIIRTSPDYNGDVRALLTGADGKLLADRQLKMKSGGGWNDLTFKIVPGMGDPHGRLALEFNSPGTLWVDFVSLMPVATFKNRANGLRRDVAQKIADLKPAFFRWPGGCVVEGITLDNRFEWKKTLGDPASRFGEYSTWGYRCSYGFGYHEMLQFCEDIGAEAMFVCNVGLGCQFRMGDASPKENIEYYIDDCLDAIEYALGPVDSEWGSKRAAAGHPAPFPLGYVEIGNENWGPEYDSRFDLFYSAIKKEYPALKLIYNEMPQREGPAGISRTDLIDPHWYVDSYFFFRNADMYDNHERDKYNIYVGEYAVNRGVGGGNMFGALAEAAFIGGLERNGDLVTMASYAPLFENRHDRSWETNLIWIDTDTVLGRSSYYVQKMASDNRPDYNLACSPVSSGAAPEFFDNGRIGFGAQKADMVFSDICIVSADGKKRAIPDISIANENIRLLDDVIEGDYELKCKVRKNGGDQGFQLYLGMTQDGKTGYKYNVGMWSSNDRAELTRISDEKHKGILAEYQNKTFDAGRWHDLRMVVNKDRSRMILDGDTILDYTSKPMPLRFVNAGYDEKTGEVVIKVVNATDSAYSTTVNLTGAACVSPEGTVETLRGESEKDENSFEDPLRISPVKSGYGSFADSFDYDFPAYSYTVLRIKATKR